MAVSVIENIARDVLATLAGITRRNGYEVDAYVYRFKTNANPPAAVDGTIEIHQDPPTIETRLTGKDDYTALFHLLVYVNQGDDTNIPLDQRRNAFVSSITKALMVDHTRSGYAIDTIPGAPANFPPDAAVEGLEYLFTVQYRTNTDDPYTP